MLKALFTERIELNSDGFDNVEQEMFNRSDFTPFGEFMISPMHCLWILNGFVLFPELQQGSHTEYTIYIYDH